MKRILTISDLHCGNISGLTPDGFNPKIGDNDTFHNYRKALYHWFQQKVESLKPIDICVANGDLIDGKGWKSGGNDNLVMKVPEQIAMATEVLKFIDAKEYHFTCGTGYHVGQEDDWETQIAKEFNSKVEDIVTLRVNDLVMKWRHHVGGSQSPTGRATPLLTKQVQDILWSTQGEYEKADILVYGHVHYFLAIQNRDGLVVSSPALQGLMGSQLGSRRLGMPVDYGFLHFDALQGKEYTWESHRLLQTAKVRNGEVLLKEGDNQKIY